MMWRASKVKQFHLKKTVNIRGGVGTKMTDMYEH